MPVLRKKRLWDPFYCKGATSANWRSLKVRNYTHQTGDFFKEIRNNTKYDIIVTNPPFSKKQVILDSLVNSKKPFIVLLRTSVLFTKWFRQLVPIFSLVLPSRQVDFIGPRNKILSFDCAFVCVGCGPKKSLHVCPR
jgi:tRNA1(Val) A37 N6-methylase TrmN6